MLLTAPGNSSQTPTVPTVSIGPVESAACSTASASSAAARNASRRPGISLAAEELAAALEIGTRVVERLTLDEVLRRKNQTSARGTFPVPVQTIDGDIAFAVIATLPTARKQFHYPPHDLP